MLEEENVGESQYGNLQALPNLTTLDHLYFNLHEIAEKAGKDTSDLVKKDLAVAYAQTMAELWQDVETHFNNIEKLSEALVKANAVLAEEGEDKIKPEFTAIVFDGKKFKRVPGNFANCTLDDCVFTNGDIDNWSAEKFENAVINNCVFDNEWFCGAINFSKAKSIDYCKFHVEFAEFSDPLYSEIDKPYLPADEANEVLISTVLTYAKKITALEEENQRLKAQVLGTQLPSLQLVPSISTASGFFESKRKNSEDAEESQDASAKRTKGI